MTSERGYMAERLNETRGLRVRILGPKCKAEREGYSAYLRGTATIFVHFSPHECFFGVPFCVCTFEQLSKYRFLGMNTAYLGNGMFLNGTNSTGVVFGCASPQLTCPAELVFVNNTFKSSYTCIHPKDFTCSSYKNDCSCPDLQPDPDIAGIGVIVSFAVVATIAIVLSYVCLFLSMINTTSLNPVDRWLREKVTRLMIHRISDRKKELWVKSLMKVLLGLSDQQLVAEMAVLFIAIVKMANGNFTVYHFAICSDLAWLSNGVHSVTLTVLGVYFRRRVKYPNRTSTLGTSSDDSGAGWVRKRRLPLMTGLRIILMCVCTALLIFTLAIAGYESWYDVFQCPVDCVRGDLKGKYGGDPGRWSTAMIIFCFMNDPRDMMILTNTGVRFFRDVRFKYMQRVDDRLKPNAPPEAILSRIYAVLKKTVTYGWWWYQSILFNVVANLLWYVLGIWTLFGDRQYGHYIMRSQGVDNKELEWGFGQLVPLIFCVLPFITAGEALWDEIITRKSRRKEYDEDSDEHEEQVEMVLGSGALQSEPMQMEPSETSVHGIERNTPSLGTSSSIVQSYSTLRGDNSLTVRRSTFPIDRFETTVP